MLAGEMQHFTHRLCLCMMSPITWPAGIHACKCCQQAECTVPTASMQARFNTHSSKQAGTQWYKQHLNVHHRLLQLYPYSFPSIVEVRLESCPKTRRGNREREKKHAEDYVTQLINKLMRSRFRWKIVSRQKVTLQLFFLPPPWVQTPDITNWKKKAASRKLN